MRSFASFYPLPLTGHLNCRRPARVIDAKHRGLLEPEAAANMGAWEGTAASRWLPPFGCRPTIVQG